MSKFLEERGGVLVFSWEYPEEKRREGDPHGERLYKFPNGEYVREQWTEGKEVNDLVPCSESRVLQLLVWLEKEGYFPEDWCPVCGASNGPIWPGGTHGKYRVGQACCSCMCA